jgi:NAD(P)-dependent dehydrogenase (short-subunit alcohol dehydrogenase family)
MSPRLDGKVALISGVSTGIGGAIAKAFAAEGAKVVCSGIQLNDINGVVDEIRSTNGVAVAAKLNVTIEADWQKAMKAIVDEFGGIDVLVNNAGILHLASFADTSLEDFRNVHQVNVDGVFLGMKTVLEVMRPGGSIINISSTCAAIGCNGHSAYGSSKAAVSGMTRHAACECAANGGGVRVNAICPGVVKSPMFIDTEENIAKVIAAQPLGIGSPHDIASAAVYLASDESRRVTGTEIIIDGGMSVRA